MQQQQQKRTHFKHIVIGVGGIGSSALYWLSRTAGADVLGIEQFDLLHSNGSSQDHSRIIRLAYDFPEYTRLAQAAFNAWSVVEDESGVKLITKCGGIVFGPKDDSHMVAYEKAMASQGIPFEKWDHRQIKEHYPQFKLTENDAALYQADSGIVDPRKASQTHIVLARARGATVLERTKVTNVRAVGTTGVEVTVADGTVYTAESLTVASGAWTNDVLKGVGTQIPLVIAQEQVSYFATPNVKDYTPERFPIWIGYGYPGVACYYGFPVYGEVATKVGEHEGGVYRPTTATTRNFEEDKPRTEKMIKYLEKYLPESLGPILYTKTCLYDLTPDRNFVLDMLPHHPQVSVFIGSGHSFKFASVVGKILAEYATRRSTTYTGGLNLFKLSRLNEGDQKAKL